MEKPPQPGSKDAPAGDDPRDSVARALDGLRTGAPGADEQLLPLVYDELRALAQHYLRDERAGHSLQATEIVHEVWLRVAGSARSDPTSRRQFFAVASRAMRNLLVDHARKRDSLKRGGDLRRVSLMDAAAEQEGEALDLLDLHEALNRLAELSETQACVVELRYFGGLTMLEVAEELELGVSTVERHWTVARAWLHRELAS